MRCCPRLFVTVGCSLLHSATGDSLRRIDREPENLADLPLENRARPYHPLVSKILILKQFYTVQMGASALRKSRASGARNSSFLRSIACSACSLCFFASGVSSASERVDKSSCPRELVQTHTATRRLLALICIVIEAVTQGLETNADADTSSAEAATTEAPTTEAPTTDAHTNAGTRRIVAGSIIVRLGGDASRHSDR